MSAGLVQLPVWGNVLALLALTHVTIAAVTIFLHRHQAHRALDLHPLPAHGFRLWLWLTTGMVTREWVAVHRKHHARCESPDDPHSPQQRGLPRVLFAGVFLYVREARNEETLRRYGHGTPDDWLERRLYSAHPRLGIALMLAIDLAVFGPLAGALIWAAQMVWIPFWAAGVINGVGHFWGYRSFDCDDASRNIVPWGLLIGGEELHNNHHAFATSARLSYRWYEVDLGWAYIRLLAALGLATVQRTAPLLRLQAPRPVIDTATVEALIRHRYDLLAHFGAGLRDLVRSELRRCGERPARHRVRALVRGLSLGDNSASPPATDVRRQVERLLEASAAVRTVTEMRQELAQVWARSHASRDQLCERLRDWVARAEASGIELLEATALRLRRYAVA